MTVSTLSRGEFQAERRRLKSVPWSVKSPETLGTIKNTANVGGSLHQSNLDTTSLIIQKKYTGDFGREYVSLLSSRGKTPEAP